MANSVPTIKNLNVDIENASNHKITNLSLPTANVEVAHALEAGLKQLVIKARGTSKLQYAFTSSESGTNYVTIHKGTSHTLTDLDFVGESLYVQASSNGETAEILELF